MNYTQAKIWTVVLSIFITVTAVAQSADDIEMAKQLARQKGYSESQIEAMMSQKQGQGTTAATVAQIKAVDRNISTKEQYGVAKQTEFDVVAAKPTPATVNIFGHDIFKNANLNFVPSYNMPTPDNYKLSAGDEVVIDIWGSVITNITTTISPEGAITIPDLGPVYIGGQTITKAEKSLKEYLSKIYSGITDPTPNTFVKLALGKIRSFTINVVGDVVTPGSYTLPSLSTIASAMYLAGGPTDIGTIREIKLYRANKLISTFDVYEFITKGTYNTNVRLEDNDIITVGPYKGIITVAGAVKRPMRYEIRGEETIDKVLAYAGGFTDAAYNAQVHIDRTLSAGEKTGATAHSFDVSQEQFSTFKVENGDIITIHKNDGRFQNRVKIAGAVWRPGDYAINTNGGQTNSNISTLRQLIEAAGGVKESAYLKKAYIVRLGENRAKEQVSFSLENIILGKDNINLFPDDLVQIFSLESITPKQTVAIYGEVNSPGAEYEYRKGMTIGDLMLMANGTTNAATLGRIEIARRISRDDDVLNKKDTVAIVMHYNLLTKPSDANTKLQPFDILFIRRSALYKTQQAITVTGEVNYPGAYVIENNTVRLSDIILKAKGFNDDAYIKGAKLTRTLTPEERARIVTAMQLAKKQTNDSTVLDSYAIGESYDIAIDLADAMANPGSYSDIVLRENDVISVPKLNNTVKISGAVLYPNTISYNPKYKWREYLANGGGALQNAKVSKVYMVHMNGSVATKKSKDFKVYPGTEIVIPMKDKKPSGQSLAAILGVASSTASLAAMVITIVNQAK
ncbi:MAG: SLBB domain-containing protein [Bacteroidales bacterium]